MPTEKTRGRDGELTYFGLIATFAVMIASTSALVWIAWTPTRLMAGPQGTWLPNLAFLAAAAAIVSFVLLRRMRRINRRGARERDRLDTMIGRVDDLTGLYNRAAINANLDYLARETPDAPFTFVLIDLDRFKEVNDTLGHQAGDLVIDAVARRLKGFFGAEAIIGRLGGDEFVVLVPGEASSSAVMSIADRLIVELSRPITVDERSAKVGASIGFLLAPTDARTRDDIMRRADQALYAAKKRGRGRAVAYDAEMERDATHRRFSERELRGGVISGEIDAEFQPIVAADGQTVVGVEALARWRHSYRGTIAPGEFIPIAEESGLIHRIGEVVLEKACRAALGWGKIFVSVNISPIQMRDPELPARVARILAETGFAPDRLVLEVTEGTLIEDPNAARAAMKALRDLGVRIALDDFGTGYSSLSYLHAFPFDKLKVDRSFVANLQVRGDAAAIIHCVVGLGRALGMTVIAEGIENEAQHEFLRAAGCQQLQGYLFGRPMTAREFARRHATRVEEVSRAA